MFISKVNLNNKYDGRRRLVKLNIKNQLNNKHIIEFCVGEKEFTLKPEEELTIEVQDEDCIYFDVVR